MVKQDTPKIQLIDFDDFEVRCKEIATLLKSNKNIKNVYGVPRGGLIPAARISYLSGIPLTFAPNGKKTAIIDDCIDSGATRHSFANFPYFYVLVDKQFENITDWIKFWWDIDGEEERKYKH